MPVLGILPSTVRSGKGASTFFTLLPNEVRIFHIKGVLVPKEPNVVKNKQLVWTHSARSTHRL